MSATVTRRSAITAAAVAVAGGVIGFLYGRNSDAAKGVATSSGGYGYGTPSTAGRLITSLDKVPEGGGVITSGLVLTRSGATGVRAYSSRCTHLGCTVNRVAGGKIFCPCHGSVFDASTGAVVNGPASAPLTPVQVVVKGGGIYST